MSKQWSRFLISLSVLAVQVWGAETPGGSPALPPKTNTISNVSAATDPITAVNADDLNQLRARIARQEEEIKRLQQSVEEQRLLLEKAIQNATSGAASTLNVANA